MTVGFPWRLIIVGNSGRARAPSGGRAAGNPYGEEVHNATMTSTPQHKRARHPMPGFVREALERHGLMEAYHSRPPYQRNDYLGWILQARRDETKEKRLAQMIDELTRGDAYMKMTYRPRAGKKEETS